MSLLQPHVCLKGTMRQVERISQQINLPITMRARHAVIDFLQQHNIRLTVLDGRDHPLRSIEPINSTDSLMDVVGYQPQFHGSLASN